VNGAASAGYRRRAGWEPRAGKFAFLSLICRQLEAGSMIRKSGNRFSEKIMLD
jgi:hypothetical protein